MIGTNRAVRVFAWAAPCDLRKGYNGLYALALNQLDGDPAAGDYFLFVNRRRSSCKVLYFDGTGLCIFMKRLERGRFAPLWREDAVEDRVQLTMSELALYIEGCQLVGVHRLAPHPP